MKVVDASPWEKRNLGMNAWEITLDRTDDDCGTFLEKFHRDRLSAGYYCVKVPVGMVNAVHRLEDEGFRFAEMQCLVSCDLAKFQVPQFFRRFDNHFLFDRVPTGSELWEDVIARISDDMFITDRIYLDPEFGPRISSQRYRNWMYDMKSDSSKSLFVSYVKKTNELIGYDVLSIKGDEAIGLLGGLFPGNAFLGAARHMLLLDYLKKCGIKVFSAGVSANNLPILKCYGQSGGVIVDSSYVLRMIVR